MYKHYHGSGGTTKILNHGIMELELFLPHYTYVQCMNECSESQCQLYFQLHPNK